jgi:hypothetical protein
MSNRPNRQNIYLPDHLRDYVAAAPSLSGRISDILDRYREAIRRTRIERRFSDDELAAIRGACAAWLTRGQPAAILFDGVAVELEDEDQCEPALIAKIRSLDPFEQIALVEWLEAAPD